MIELLEAIQRRFACSAKLKETFPNGVYLSQAPDGMNKPFCVMTIVSVVDDYSTIDASRNKPYVETVTVQFSVFCDTDAFGLIAQEYIDRAFNFAALELGPNGDRVSPDVLIDSTRKTGSVPMRVDERTWNVFTEYQFKVHRILSSYYAEHCDETGGPDLTW